LASSQAKRVIFRYNRTMQTRSPQSLAVTPVALGLMGVLAFSGAGCDVLGIGTGKPVPIVQHPAPLKPLKSDTRQAGQALPGFGLAGPQNVGDDPGPEPAVAVTHTASPAGSTTLNGNPNGLSRDVLNSAIQGTMGSLASCFSPSAENPMVSVSFEADPSGRPSLVRVNGAPPDAERCVRNLIQGMRFARFEGNGVHVDLPLTFHQVGRTQAAPAPAGEAPRPSGPPLYIDP